MHFFDAKAFSKKNCSSFFDDAGTQIKTSYAFRVFFVFYENDEEEYLVVFGHLLLLCLL